MPNRIEELMKEFNYNLEYLSNYLSVSDRMIRHYEKETKTIPLSTAIKLCELFNCSLDYLLCRSEARNNILKVEEYYAGIINDCTLNNISPEQLKKIIDILKEVKISK